MSLHRKAAKRDASEASIVEALKKSGWSVLQVSVKDGPDLFAARRGRSVAIECKTGTKKLQPGQDAFRQAWQGEYVICRSVADVLALDKGE